MENTEIGCVYWITGLSGAGKTTVSRLLFNRIKKKKANVVLLDGDELRSVLAVEENYLYEERKKLAFTYCRLCKMLAEQGCDVVIATVSMFYACHEWNRAYLPRYYEIYLRVPIEVLLKRNQKNLFLGDKKNIVGIDIAIEEPKTPDLIIENYGDFTPLNALEEIWRLTRQLQSFSPLSIF